jgi:heat shock protein HtpX
MAIQTAQNSIAANLTKTYLLMLLFSLFVVGVVYIFARGYGYDSMSGLAFAGWAFIIAGVMNFFSYFYSDKMVLGISGAQLVEKKNNPELYRLVENLCIANGQPAPKIYLINDTAPNAFATGRNAEHSVVCFTTGIIDKLNKQELEAVVGHELSHIKNRDTLLMTVVSILVGLVALLADWFLRISWYGGDDDNKGNTFFFVIALVSAVLAPIIGTLIQLAISRRREFLADASSALLTRNPEALAQALLKISSDKEPLEVANRATAHLYIANPLKGSEAVGWFAGLFNTHPPITDRVHQLRNMQGI